MSASLTPRHETAVLPSLPPSPSLLDEVFSHPRPWSVQFDKLNTQGSRRSSLGSPDSSSKGKERQTLEEEDEEDTEDAQHRGSTHEAYPPISDETAETRRVEETLRRWELAERQRRKSVRESTQHTSRPSFLSSVTRTASLVLSRRSASVSASVGPGSTRAFKSYDVAREGYVFPLDDVDHPSRVAVHSPSLVASSEGTGRLSSGTPENQNPFVHPSERTSGTSTPTLTPSPPPSPSPLPNARGRRAELSMDAPDRVSGSREPFVSRLLNSRASPSDKPRVTPLQPTSQPALRPSRPAENSGEQEVRWWHDWLCGCSEGSDRGGDNQAGRTNPFE